MKTAEDYWFEYSHESIVEGLRAITEANFKQAIRACQSELNDEIRTVKAQWIGMMEEYDTLIIQIEYLNKEAKKAHDKIMKLEFENKSSNRA